MKFEKGFIYSLKYDNDEKFFNEDNYKVISDIISEYCRETNCIVTADNINDKNYIIWMLYVIHIHWDLNKITNCVSYSKLKEEFSLPFYLYTYILKNYNLFFELIPEDILGSYMRYPDEIRPLPEVLVKFINDNSIKFDPPAENIEDDADNLTDVVDLEDEDLNLPVVSETDESIEDISNEAINVLWISRHPILQAQINELIAAYGNINLYQSRDRIGNMSGIDEMIDKYNINTIVAVLPDTLLLELHNRFHNKVSILRSAYVKSCIPIHNINNNNEKLMAMQGFEKIVGYKIVTESIQSV